MPLAGAWVCTGPRWVTTMGSLPLKAGYRLVTTLTCQGPSGGSSPLRVSAGVLVVRAERARRPRLILDRKAALQEI